MINIKKNCTERKIISFKTCSSMKIIVLISNFSFSDDEKRRR